MAFIDLNDLRVFASVASRRSFSVAAQALGMPNSSVSRSVKRLETAVGARLIQRTTREVGLTEAGAALHARCVEMLTCVDEALDFVSSLSAQPRGRLRINLPIGVAHSLPTDFLPNFLSYHPEIDVVLELNSRVIDLVAEEVDVAIRMGSLPDSRLIARQLGTIRLVLCASPAYLERQGVPSDPSGLHGHATIEMLGPSGTPRSWVFINESNETAKVEIQPRLTVNDPVMIYKLVLNGAGLGCLPGHLCHADLQAGRLIRLLTNWTVPAVDMSVVFSSSRGLSPAIRAFVDQLVAAAESGRLPHVDPRLASISSRTGRA